MSQRKRMQGQHRRLLKYIKSQTGGTNPNKLLKRESDLQVRIDEIQKQIDDLKLTVETTNQPNGTSATYVAGAHIDPEVQAQQSARLEYLCTMHQHLKDTLNINRRIYDALCG